MAASRQQMDGTGYHHGQPQQQYVDEGQHQFQNPNLQPPNYMEAQNPNFGQTSQTRGTGAQYVHGAPNSQVYPPPLQVPRPQHQIPRQQPQVMIVQAPVQHTRAQIREFSHNVCESICLNPQYSCFVCFCAPCAIGDLRAGAANNRKPWNTTVGVTIAINILLGIMSALTGVNFEVIYWIVCIYFAFKAAGEVSAYLGFIWTPAFQDFCALFCCLPCFICVLGNELKIPHPRSEELLLSMEMHSPCGIKPDGPRHMHGGRV